MKNYLSDPNTFTKGCENLFVPGMSRTLYGLYGEDTLDFMNSFINQFSVNTDPETVDQLVFASDCFAGYRKKGRCPGYTKYLADHINIWNSEHGKVSQLYAGVPGISMEVFHFVHGLRYTHQEIRDYVMERDIIDVGAYYGESAVKLA